MVSSILDSCHSIKAHDRGVVANVPRAEQTGMAFMRYSPVRALPQGDITVEEFRAWLSQFDADGNGRICREELEQALRSLNLWFAWWKAREAMRAADANRNGEVDADEMARLYAFAHKHLHVKMSELDEYQIEGRD